MKTQYWKDKAEGRETLSTAKTAQSFEKDLEERNHGDGTTHRTIEKKE